MNEWIRVEDGLPADFVSVLGHMTDAGEFPSVRECYMIGSPENFFYFPALQAVHPVDKWMDMPTIEAELVRHGRWDYYSTTMQECSVCKRHTPRHRYTFCPHCGARMDGDTE